MDNPTSPVAKPPKYLVCVDIHDESHAALRFACMKANLRQGSVDMLHVIPPADFQTLGMIADRMRDERLREGKELLQKLADEAATIFHITPRPILREGNIGEEIMAVVMENADITMMVIGSAQHTGKSGTLAGWLAGQLGGKLVVPLLMVPGNLTDLQLRSLV